MQQDHSIVAISRQNLIWLYSTHSPRYKKALFEDNIINSQWAIELISIEVMPTQK